MKCILEHEIYGPVLFDTKTQSYEYIDRKDFTFIGSERYFENVAMFEVSSFETGVIPLICTGFKQVKKRTLATFLDWNNRILNFYNVEMINGSWTRNCIELVDVNKCYLVLLEKNQKAVNDFILTKIYEVKKKG